MKNRPLIFELKDELTQNTPDVWEEIRKKSRSKHC